MDNSLTPYEEMLMAAHEARQRARQAERSARDVRHKAAELERLRENEERIRLRELRNRHCGAKTRAGHPCRRKGLGRGGRCANHGGSSTGPRTTEGRAREARTLREKGLGVPEIARRLNLGVATTYRPLAEQSDAN
jgi:hypothetical protein